MESSAILLLPRIPVLFASQKGLIDLTPRLRRAAGVGLPGWMAVEARMERQLSQEPRLANGRVLTLGVAIHPRRSGYYLRDSVLSGSPSRYRPQVTDRHRLSVNARCLPLRRVKWGWGWVRGDREKGRETRLALST